MTGFYVFLGFALLAVIYLAFLAGRRDGKQQERIKAEKVVGTLLDASIQSAREIRGLSDSELDNELFEQSADNLSPLAGTAEPEPRD